MKVQFITTTVIQGGHIKGTSLDGYTKSNFEAGDPDQAIFRDLRPLVNAYVRDRVVMEGQAAEAVVRTRVTRIRKNAEMNIELKIIEVR